MAAYESPGESNEWYTPHYIFDALACRFDMDVAAPVDRTHVCVPAREFVTSDSLTAPWSGFVWMNPPFGHQATKRQWLAKFFDHANGIALTPDRTSAPWFQETWAKADLVMFLPKVKFFRPDGTRGEQPGTGTCLWASGWAGKEALRWAAKEGLGILATPERLAA